MGYTVNPGEIKRVLGKRDEEIKGGVDVIMVGAPGCGKTTGLANMALLNHKLYGDVIIWRGSHDCQWGLFLNRKIDMPIILWLKKGLSYDLIDRKTGKHVNIRDYVEVREWDSPDALVYQLDHSAINIVETTPYTPRNPAQHLQFCREWIDIWDALTHRSFKTPVSIYFDEFEDLVPEGCGKDFWDAELSFSGIIRACRKNDISSFLATHSLEEVHWRIRKKIRWTIYMKGGRPTGQSAIKRGTKHLKVGEAFIEGTNFEKFSFENMGDDLKLRAIIKPEEPKEY